MAIAEPAVKSRLPSAPASARASRPRRRGNGWIGIACVAALIGSAAFLARAQWAESANGRLGFEQSFQTHTVARETLRIVVTEDGNVESADNIDLKCRIEGGSTILWIMPEGTQVAKGDKLVELDSFPIQEKLRAQQILFATAQTAFIQAKKDFEIAEISVNEYSEGSYRQELQQAEANIAIARQNLKSAQDMFNHAENIFRRGYIAELQLEANEDAVDRARLELDLTQTIRDVLVKFTRAKRLKELESLRDAAKEKMEAEKAKTELEKFKLDRLKEQLELCVLHAPQYGMVVYANDPGRRFRSESSLIEEGAAVRERQSIIRLPDLASMQVRALVHETKVNRIKPEMRSTIKIRDSVRSGSVVSVAAQPESSGWFNNNVKEYPVVVSLDGDMTELGLKPGMTAEVEILVREVTNCLTIPLLGVVEQGSKYYCYLVDDGAGWKKREVKLGDSSDKYIEITDGLAEGDVVILNPRATIADAQKIIQPEPTDQPPSPSAGDKKINTAAAAEAKEKQLDSEAKTDKKNALGNERKQSRGDKGAGRAANEKKNKPKTTESRS